MTGVMQERSTLVLGTRGSKLAVHQSEWVQARIRELAPHVTVTLRRIQTSGDKILDVPLAKIGGKGLFVKEIEEALLSGDIDLAVHSMKDVPTQLPAGLDLLCVPLREDPRDALISRDGRRFKDLPSGARIGTSSLRRQAQLLQARPDVSISMLRGNLDTRLKKLREGHFDAIVLAAAGLRRLGWEREITEYLAPEISLPAIGQGALGIEGRDRRRLRERSLERPRACSDEDHGHGRAGFTAPLAGRLPGADCGSCHSERIGNRVGWIGRERGRQGSHSRPCARDDG